MKSIGDSVVLAMRDDYLDNSSYEYMAAGYYDENTMNRFADNFEEEGDWGILEFTNETPTDYYHPANGNNNPRPFGKRYDSAGDNTCCHNNKVWHFRYYTRHFLFIRTGNGYGYDPVELGTGCYPSNCDQEYLQYL